MLWRKLETSLVAAARIFGNQLPNPNRIPNVRSGNKVLRKFTKAFTLSNYYPPTWKDLKLTYTWPNSKHLTNIARSERRKRKGMMPVKKGQGKKKQKAAMKAAPAEKKK